MRLLILIFTVIELNSVDARFRKRNLNYCQVKDNNEFHFRELTNAVKDYVIEHEHHKNVSLRLQLCRPLKNNCNGVDGYSICLSKNGQEIGVGKDPPQVISEFQEIIFKFSGDPCKDKQNYTASIKMICDYSITDGHGIGLFAADPDECDFDMQWKTKAACTEKKKVNCTVDDKSGQHYDLSPLINYSDNYEVSISKQYSVILNVCHSVLYRRNVCKTTNAACLIDKNDITGFRSENLGEPEDSLNYNSDGSLSLTYVNGKICSSTNADTSNVKTTITFFCDLNATESLPKYTGGMDKCHYQFNWRTASACSEQALQRKSLEKTNNDFCSVKDPITDQIYNLTTLMNKDFNVSPFGVSNGVVKFAVCSSLINNPCKAGAGSCKIHNKTSGGIANSKLLWKEKGPYLNYTNGDRCYNNQQRYTIIEFYCGAKDYDIVQTSLCYDTIRFNTPLACQNKKKCATQNNEVNLSQLTLKKYNYAIQMNNTKFHINICQNLVTERGLNCPNRTSICKITISDNGKETITNLGFYNESPILTGDSSVVLTYKNGSICKEDKKQKIESSITFLCDIHSELGYPRLKKYENCTYFLEWKTNIVCGKVDGTLKNNVINNSFGDARDLSSVLSKINGPIVNVKNDRGETYKISLSEDKKVCDGAFICDDKINYGTKLSVLYDYNINNVQLQFTDGSKCGDDIAQATITMKCKEENIVSSPELMKEKACDVEFQWLTSAMCTSQKSSEIALIYADKSTIIYSGEIIGIVIVILLILLTIICCLTNPTRRSRLLEIITNSTGRHGDRVKYSRVNTEEEVHLLLNTSDPTVVESDSDDDLLGD